MGLYRKYVLPRLVHLACSGEPTTKQRMKVVPQARGRVVEVGIGSGLNLPFYDPDSVVKVWGVDPSPEMTAMAVDAAKGVSFSVEVVLAGGEEIPLDGSSFDTVLCTYALCTIPDPVAAVREMARVLAPGGRLLFLEHGLAPDAGVRRWQRWIDPAWRRLGGGCRLNRDIPDLLRQGGFEITGMEAMYIPGWRPASYNYWGAAVVG